MRVVIRYTVLGAMLVVAVLGIPLIFPTKENPYSGKSVGGKAALEIKA